jgi:hypothetical protein
MTNIIINVSIYKQLQADSELSDLVTKGSEALTWYSDPELSLRFHSERENKQINTYYNVGRLDIDIKMCPHNCS